MRLRFTILSTKVIEVQNCEREGSFLGFIRNEDGSYTVKRIYEYKCKFRTYHRDGSDSIPPNILEMFPVFKADTCVYITDKFAYQCRKTASGEYEYVCWAVSEDTYYMAILMLLDLDVGIKNIGLSDYYKHICPESEAIVSADEVDKIYVKFNLSKSLHVPSENSEFSISLLAYVDHDTRFNVHSESAPTVSSHDDILMHIIKKCMDTSPDRNDLEKYNEYDSRSWKVIRREKLLDYIRNVVDILNRSRPEYDQLPTIPKTFEF